MGLIGRPGAQQVTQRPEHPPAHLGQLLGLAPPAGAHQKTDARQHPLLSLAARLGQAQHPQKQP